MNDVKRKQIRLKSDYILTVAWTNNQSHPTNSMVDLLVNFLIDNNARFVDSEEVNFDYCTEHMQYFNWSGDEKGFKKLQKKANFILDNCYTDKYEKFNTSIFGSKR
jgi:hypothetical protein